MSGEPRLLVRVDAAHALTAAGAAGIAALHATGRVDAIVLGRARPGGADPSAVAAFVASTHPDLDLVIEASLDGDYVYNLARRLASLQALGSRAAGVLLPPGEADGVAALHLLWQSWPRASIVGDRATRTFVDVARLRRVDRAGSHPVAGPLQTPVDQHDLPVVLQRLDPRHPELSAHADVVVVPLHAAAAGLRDQTRAVFDETRSLFVEANVDGEDPGDALDAALALRPAGVVVAADPAGLAERLGRGPAPAVERSGGLRRRWRLPAPPLTLSGAQPFQRTGQAS